MVKTLVFVLFVLSAVSSCSSKKLTAVAVNGTNVVPLDYRPTFHFAPKANWTNDPNGLVYYKGQYHVFYQYNPYSDVWGHMSWGHATSTDLFNWKHQPVAIMEYENADKTMTGVFSGTTIVDSFNTSGFGTSESPMPLIAIYTSNIDKVAQNQSLAYSLDGYTFNRFANNPILDIHSQEFRDPDRKSVV